MGLDNPLHIAFLLIVVLMVFGARRLPEMGRSLGSGLRGFKDALDTGSSGGPAQVHTISDAVRPPVDEQADGERAAA